MSKPISQLALSIVATFLISASANSAPVALTEAQLDSVAAGGVETVSGFVCTVNTHFAGLATAADKSNSAKVAFNPVSGVDINGEFVSYYTVAPSGAGDLNVPVQATNTGTPGAGFSTPGDTTYSPIWNRSNF